MLVERGWIKSLNHVSLPCLANTPLFESFHRTRRKRKTSRREPARLLSPACSGNEFLDVSRGVFRPPLNAHLPSHLHFNFGAIQIVKKLRIGICQYIGNVVSVLASSRKRAATLGSEARELSASNCSRRISLICAAFLLMNGCTAIRTRQGRHLRLRCPRRSRPLQHCAAM